MYEVWRTKSFHKSLLKLKKSGTNQVAYKKLDFAVNTLAKGDILPVSYKDHSLQGEFNGCRECHIKDDLLLVYKIEKENLVFLLMDLDPHSKLFG